VSVHKLINRNGYVYIGRYIRCEEVLVKFSYIGLWFIYFSVVYQLIYDDLVGRVKEKEEKEARKLQRLAEEFTNLLHTFKVYLSYQGWLSFCLDSLGR